MLYLIDFLQAKKASNSLVNIHFVMNCPCAPHKSMTIYLTVEMDSSQTRIRLTIKLALSWLLSKSTVAVSCV